MQRQRPAVGTDGGRARVGGCDLSGSPRGSGFTLSFNTEPTGPGVRDPPKQQGGSGSQGGLPGGTSWPAGERGNRLGVQRPTEVPRAATPAAEGAHQLAGPATASLHPGSRQGATLPSRAAGGPAGLTAARPCRTRGRRGGPLSLLPPGPPGSSGGGGHTARSPAAAGRRLRGTRLPPGGCSSPRRGCAASGQDPGEPPGRAAPPPRLPTTHRTEGGGCQPRTATCPGAAAHEGTRPTGKPINSRGLGAQVQCSSHRSAMGALEHRKLRPPSTTAPELRGKHPQVRGGEQGRVGTLGGAAWRGSRDGAPARGL